MQRDRLPFKQTNNTRYLEKSFRKPKSQGPDRIGPQCHINRREAFRVLEHVSGVIVFVCTVSRESGNLIWQAQCTHYAKITAVVHNPCAASH